MAWRAKIPPSVERVIGGLKEIWMNKQDVLKVKLLTLIHEIENAKNMVDAETQKFLIT